MKGGSGVCSGCGEFCPSYYAGTRCYSCERAANNRNKRAMRARDPDRNRRHTAKSNAQRRDKILQWQKDNPENRRWSALKNKYDISKEEYLALLRSQGGACAICGGEPKEGKLLYVDHDHETGVVRGLLCPGCNTTLAALGDTLGALRLNFPKYEAYLFRSHLHEDAYPIPGLPEDLRG